MYTWYSYAYTSTVFDILVYGDVGFTLSDEALRIWGVLEDASTSGFIVRDTSNDIVNTIRPWSVMQRYRPNVKTKREGTDCGNKVVKNGNPNFYHKTIAKVSVGLLQSKQKTQFRKRFSEYKTIPYETSVPIRHVRYLFRLDSTACR